MSEECLPVGGGNVNWPNRSAKPWSYPTLPRRTGTTPREPPQGKPSPQGPGGHTGYPSSTSGQQRGTPRNGESEPATTRGAAERKGQASGKTHCLVPRAQAPETDTT